MALGRRSPSRSGLRPEPPSREGRATGAHITQDECIRTLPILLGPTAGFGAAHNPQ